jgi:hypothetical protein
MVSAICNWWHSNTGDVLMYGDVFVYNDVLVEQGKSGMPYLAA